LDTHNTKRILESSNENDQKVKHIEHETSTSGGRKQKPVFYVESLIVGVAFIDYCDSL